MARGVYAIFASDKDGLGYIPRIKKPELLSDLRAGGQL